MTAEEAIRWIQLIKDTHIGNEKLDKLSVCALNMAISALRAQAEAEKNEFSESERVGENEH